MARRILIIGLLLLSFALNLDYEVIKNNDGNRDIVSIYLNNKEVLSLIGSETAVFEKAYSLISKLIQYRYLEYDPNMLKIDKSPGFEYVMFWDDKILLHLSQDEKKLNDKRGNGIDEIKSFVKTIGGDTKHYRKIEIPERKLSIRDVNRIKIVAIKQPPSVECFPAIHQFLPVGTKMRIMNPETDWSVVVQVVQNEDLGMESLIGLPQQAANAIGVSEAESVVIRTQIL